MLASGGVCFLLPACRTMLAFTYILLYANGRIFVNEKVWRSGRGSREWMCLTQGEYRGTGTDRGDNFLNDDGQAESVLADSRCR